jgi:hypothetical protein
MAHPEQLDWAEFLGSWGPFALSLAPFLSNTELFTLSSASRKLLKLRYDLGRWSIKLGELGTQMDDSYERFCGRRHSGRSVPACSKGPCFDLVAHLGSRLRLKIINGNIKHAKALAECHTLDLWHCNSLSDVSALRGVYKLTLMCCSAVTDVTARAHVHTHWI